VDEMSRARHERQQALRAGECAFRRRRRFDRVNVIVVRAGVVRSPSEHALEYRHELQRVGCRRAVGGPQLPRPQIHQRVRVHHGNLRIIWESLMNGLHRFAVPRVQRLGRHRRVERVANRQRVGECRFDWRAAATERHRLLRRLVGALTAFAFELRHVAVIVQAERDAHAPPRHRRLGIELSGLQEGTLRLGMIEVLEKREPLIEIALRLWTGGSDRVGVRAHPVEQLRAGGALRCRQAS
jgi:hypothetical protein